jgi:hypothetical protein
MEMKGKGGPLKKIAWVAIAVLAALVLLLPAGFRLPDLAGQLLIAACGAFFIQRGVDQIQARYARSSGGALAPGMRTYTGWAAVAKGTGLVLGGSVILAVALYFAMGREDAAWGFVKAHPGPALLLAGAFLASWSLSIVIGPEEERAKRSIPRFLLAVPKRILSLALLAAALALAAGGIVDIAAPGTFGRLVSRLAGLLQRLR